LRAFRPAERGRREPWPIRNQGFGTPFDEGALVVLADRQQSKLENVASTLAKDRILTHVTDVAHYGQVEALMNTTLRRFGSMCSSTMPASPLAAESSMQA
jgi:NAD(P)-dependent dehydrogenase (short-subunit alcohol dehydrogenase family)